ncbi:MAG: YabP/YqfC family sporulation protein [Oscillospiraceae bacterium]|nr:YabP/YqfC family sporulation protein [Oscillospiraceae bacterium]
MNIKQLAQKYEKAKHGLMKHSSLQITDNREVIADGCRKIISCDDNIVIIDGAQARVTITGDSLKLRNWGTDGVTISGKVKSVEFDENVKGGSYV